MTTSIELKPVALDAGQQKAWDQTRTAVFWNCPAFAHILMELMNKNNKTKGQLASFSAIRAPLFVDFEATAAVDGQNLIINPALFFKYNLNERLFIVLHEIAHAVADHPGLMHRCVQAGGVSYADGTKLRYDHRTMNIAMDLWVNDMLIESKCGTFNKDWLHDTSYGTQMTPVLDIYRKIIEEQDGKGGGKDKGAGKGRPAGKGFDAHLPPGTADGVHPSDVNRNQHQWDMELAAGMAAAKAQGKLPANIARMFGEILEPKVSWQEHIRATFMRRTGTGSRSWRRPDRRFIVRDIVVPGRTGNCAGHVIVGADTSGSISQKELDMIFAELQGIINEVNPERISVVWCDAEVNRVDEVEGLADLDMVRTRGVVGGGGTDFRPVFQWISDSMHEPECLVYVTDTYGTFPDTAPDFPVIWASLLPGRTVPFGDLIEIPRE
jgi:predicted metal-dependent peptidase